MKRTVYLAGPIFGCTLAEANDWRDATIARLRKRGIQGVSPLRCEPIHGERYGMEYVDPRFGTPRAISSKNMLDVKMCDVTLAYMPTLSLGTLIELAWAYAFGKPTILVTTLPQVRDHAVVQACAGWVLSTLDEAADVIEGVLTVYAE